MNLNFAAVIAALGANAAFKIANAARVAADYLFATLLPERLMPTYDVKDGTMTVRSTMAGLVGMDSPYPPGGVIDVSTFLEGTAKLGNHVPLSEQALRTLQDMLLRLNAAGRDTSQFAQVEALNFLDKAIIQPHMDRAEWLRGQALLGSINWEFGGKSLVVDYGIPAANILAARVGNDGYGGSASKFWVDLRALKRALKGNVRAYIVSPNTLDMIRYNAVNNLTAVNEVGGTVTFRKVNANGQFTQDTGDTVTLIAYEKEGEVLDPLNSSVAKHVPFMLDGKIIAVGNNTRPGYVVGGGSTDNPADDKGLGYTHVAPTTEGGGQPGRWAQLYVPEATPWLLAGRGASNVLPVVEAPSKLAVATTDMV